MNKTIRSGARSVIYKVFLRCLAENEAGQLLSALDDVYQRTADMTGVSVNTVRNIEKEYYDRGRNLYTEIERLVINLRDDSSTDDWSESEDEVAESSNQEEYFSGVKYLDEELLEAD